MTRTESDDVGGFEGKLTIHMGTSFICVLAPQ
jgi:hypothetical protein